MSEFKNSNETFWVIFKHCVILDFKHVNQQKLFFAGFFLAAAFSNHASYIHAAIGSFFPVFTLSGSFWPLDGVPVLLRIVSWYQPCTFAVHAVRDIMTKGWAVSVYYALITTLVWIGIFIVAAFIAVRIRSPK